MSKRKSTEILKFIFGGKLLVVILTWFAMNFLVDVAIHAEEALDKIVINSARSTGWFVFAISFIILVMYIYEFINEEKK